MTSLARDCWCGAHEAQLEFTWGLPGLTGQNWVRCSRCGVYALHPPPSDQQLRKAYSAEYYGEARRKFVPGLAWLFQAGQRCRARQVVRRLPKRARVLDVGCGNGEFLACLQARGCVGEGTEWSAQSAARVPTQAGIRVHVGDLLELDLPEAAYDAVTLWHVLEHVRDVVGTLERIRTLLRPGGWLVVEVPNMDSRQSKRFGTHWFHLDPPRHLYGFGVRTLERLLVEHGFEVVSRGTFSLLQGVYGYVQSQLNAWGFPRDRAYGCIKGTRQGGRWGQLLDYALLGLLAPVGLGHCLWAATAGRGTVLRILARRK